MHPPVVRKVVIPDHPPKQNRLLRLGIWGGLVAIFAFAFYLVLSPKPAPKKGGGGRRGVSGPITITTAAAQKGDIGHYLDSIGTVTPVYTSSIFAQVTGTVIAVHYTEGQMVNKGDPLVDLDARPYQASLLQAQGALERDQNLLGQAQMDLKRYQDAWARNAVSKQILDDQEKLVHQDQGIVKNDEGAVKGAEVQVEYCHIVAPISGRVGLRLIDPGNLINAGSSATTSPLAVVTQIQPITVVFTVAEDFLGPVLAQLRKNSKLTVEVYDRADQTKIATGELTALDNQVDTTTGTVRVRSTFANEDSSLFPNQFVNIRLLVETLKDVTLVPTATIQRNGDTAFVYVIQDEVAHLRNVKVGISDERAGVTEVEGVDPGETLANSSFDKLQDNDKVVLASSNPAAGHAHAGGHGGNGEHGGHGGQGGQGGNGPKGQ